MENLIFSQSSKLAETPDPAQQQAGDADRPVRVKRVLILMSDTGGGHRAAAEAIQEGCDHLYKGMVAVTIVDAWKNHVAWPINRTADTYSWLVNRAVWLWKSIWFLENVPRLVDNILKLFYPLVAPGLYKLFLAQSPDVIVSVHPLFTQLPLMVLRRKELNIPFVTVVTDLVSGYHTWYHPNTTLCLVPTDLARTQALRVGMPPEKVEVVGQPVALKFTARMKDKSYLRAELGLDLNLSVVLLVGGGEGFGPLFEIARCIAEQRPRAQLLIVTGRNEALRQKLEAVVWEIPTRIYGFVTNMPDLMGATDIFITKAGPGSISEAFIAGLPLILFGYIPGQEEGNVRYVQENNAGVYLPEPQAVANTVVDWLQPDNPGLTQMSENAARLARPEAVLTIARRIYGIVA
jgi:1,2-diacylglycerol 3-beta-galactosyltransferase